MTDAKREELFGKVLKLPDLVAYQDGTVALLSVGAAVILLGLRRRVVPSGTQKFIIAGLMYIGSPTTG